FNADLANDLGNLLSRLAKMINGHCQGAVPAPEAPIGAEEETLRAAALQTVSDLWNHLDAMRPDLGLAAVIALIRAANRLQPGTRLAPGGILFPRIMPPKPAVAPPVKAAENVAVVEYADFAKLQLRTAHILSAERVPDADRLLKLRIKVDTEERQLVAGIAAYYQPEDLPGKTIVIIANLKPARIRGIESQGMLLAASKGKTLRLLTVDGEIPDGAAVK
ncbi:MAG: methionine--tRNA ligase subunit beta, partial [Kiritimatiellia bacterium]